MLRKWFVLGLVTLLSSGCVRVKLDTLSDEESTELKGKTVVYTQYGELPDFPATTATNSQFAVMGAFAAISNGNSMIQKNEIEDPALELAKQLSGYLKSEYGMSVVDSNEVLSVKSKVPDVIEAYRGVDYILDAKTVSWASAHYPSDWGNYRVFYNAHARLIDTAQEAVVAEVMCHYQSDYEDTNQSPTYEELEDGSGFRREFGLAVEKCVEDILSSTQLR